MGQKVRPLEQHLLVHASTRRAQDACQGNSTVAARRHWLLTHCYTHVRGFVRGYRQRTGRGGGGGRKVLVDTDPAYGQPPLKAAGGIGMSMKGLAADSMSTVDHPMSLARLTGAGESL